MHLTVTIAYDDLSVTASASTDSEAFDGELLTELAGRSTAALIDGWEALALVSARLASDS